MTKEERELALYKWQTYAQLALEWYEVSSRDEDEQTLEQACYATQVYEKYMLKQEQVQEDLRKAGYLIIWKLKRGYGLRKMTKKELLERS